MFKQLPSQVLSKYPQALRRISKIALGVLIIALFIDYQPALDFPPVRSRVVKAAVEQTATVSPASLPFTFQLPHPGYLSTNFSTWHQGLDIATGLGMPIKPITSGTVTSAGFNFWGLGLTVTVDHGNGYSSTYAHMGKIYVKEGQIVENSSTLGEVGLTGRTSGPHTHLEVYKDGKNIDPLPLLPTMRDIPIAEDFQVYGTGGKK